MKRFKFPYWCKIPIGIFFQKIRNFYLLTKTRFRKLIQIHRVRDSIAKKFFSPFPKNLSIGKLEKKKKKTRKNKIRITFVPHSSVPCLGIGAFSLPVSSLAQSRDTVTQNSIRARAYDRDRRDLLDTRRPPCDTKSVGRLFWKKRRSPRGSGIVYSVAMPGFIVSRARDVPSRSRLNLACRFTAGTDIGGYIISFFFFLAFKIPGTPERLKLND